MRDELVVEISKYLENHVGETLRDGLQAMWREKPERPTHWLGRWLVDADSDSNASAYRGNSTIGTVIHRSNEDIVLCVCALRGDLFCGFRGGSIRVWSAETQSWDRSMNGNENGAWSLFCEDTTCYAGDGAGNIRVWDHRVCKVGKTLEGHSGHVFCLATSGEHLFSGSGDKTVRMWHKTGGECMRVMEGHSGPVWALCCIDDSTLCSASPDSTVRVWTIADGVCAATLDAKGAACALSLVDGLLWVGGQKSISVWSVPNRECTKTVQASSDYIRAMAAQGDKIVTGGMNGEINVWSASDCSLVEALQDPGPPVTARPMACTSMAWINGSCYCCLQDRVVKLNLQLT